MKVVECVCATGREEASATRTTGSYDSDSNRVMKVCRASHFSPNPPMD